MDAEKIQLAADLIERELLKRGVTISQQDCLYFARQIHHLWDNVLPEMLPREIAQKQRNRYEGDIPAESD